MLTACLLSLALLAAAPDAAQLQRYEFEQTHMGMSFKLILYAPDSQAANQASEAAFARVKQLDLVMSDYLPDSELNRLSDTAPSPRPVPLGDDLFRVLTHAQEIAEKSDGAFDVTVGPIVHLWRKARRSKKMPPPEALAAAREATGFRGLTLDAKNQTAQLTKPKMRLDLGGIGCGYACDETLKLLAKLGIRRALLDASGDIIVGDPPPGRDAWRIGIAKLNDPFGVPGAYLMLANAAVTTSGDAFQYVELDGVRYSHIVDPHTGLGLTTHSVVAVIAPRCIDADAWTKPVCVLGPEKGFPLIDQVPGAAAFVEREVNGKLEKFQSSRWKDFKFETP